MGKRQSLCRLNFNKDNWTDGDRSFPSIFIDRLILLTCEDCFFLALASRAAISVKSPLTSDQLTQPFFYHLIASSDRAREKKIDGRGASSCSHAIFLFELTRNSLWKLETKHKNDFSLLIHFGHNSMSTRKQSLKKIYHRRQITLRQREMKSFCRLIEL